MGGIRSQMEKNAKDVVVERVNNRKNYLQSDMLVTWTNLTDLETLINENAEQLDTDGVIDLDNANPTSAEVEPLLMAVSDDVVQKLRNLRVNSIFLVLGLSDTEQNGLNGMSKPGLYIIDQDSETAPSERNTDLLLERGSSNMIKNLGIATSLDWEPSFTFANHGGDCADFVYQSATAEVNGKQNNIRDLGYWAFSKPLADSSENMLTYSVPLKTKDGKTYGVLGVGILENYLKHILPNEEIHESDSGYYCLAIRDGDSDNYKIVYTDNDGLKKGTVLNLPQNQNIYRSEDNTEMFVAADELNLYNRNTLYEQERWYLIGFVPQEELMSFANYINLILQFSVIIMVLVGVFGGIGVTLRITKPIKRLYNSMEKSHDLPKTNITEIDRLVTKIETLNCELQKDNTHIIKALTRDYQNVYMVNPQSDTVKVVKLGNSVSDQGAVGIKSDSLSDLAEQYSAMCSNEAEQKKMRYALSADGMAKNFADRDEYSAVYQMTEKDTVHYCQLKIMQSQQDGQYIIAFQNIDTVMLEEKRQQKRYENALEETKRAYEEAQKASAAKTNFLSRMSHDIRTPINGIVGMMHIMESEIDDRKKVEYSIEKVKHLSHQLELLVNDVLEMSRIESGKIVLSKESFDIEKTVNELFPAISVMAEERGVILTEPEFDIQHTNVISSPLHIQRIVMNILSNAVKYNRMGGTLKCKLEEKSVDTSHSNFVFTVSDTGIGMSEDFIQRIYEPFTREQTAPETTYAGTGLGMAITKELVDMLTGTIRIESQKDVGTTVTICLPLELGEEVVKNKTENIPVSLQGKKILLVEDNRLNMEIAMYILQEEQAVIEVAMNGAEAVEKFKASSINEYDLILMDIMMPVMNGYEAARTIRALDRADAKTVPIFAMTANAFSEDERESRAAGMNDHIAKPLDIDVMMSKIKNVLSK